jgi:hypothetical protein
LRAEYWRFSIVTARSDSDSFNPLLLKVTISSNNESFFICYMDNHTLQIIFDNWWDFINVNTKCAIVWNNPTHRQSWNVFLHCRIEVSGSQGIISIICHQVLCHPTNHGTNTIEKCLVK